MQNYISLSVLLLLLAAGSRCAQQQTAPREYFDRILAQPKCPIAREEQSTLPQSCGKSYTRSGGYMEKVEDLLERECDLVDPIRCQNNEQILQEDHEVDFLVVGAGTAGSIVAGRLATTEEKWEVALLEAGGPYPTGTMFPGSYFSYAKEDSIINWDFELEPQKYACKGYKDRKCHWPRGKVLGGTGAIHGMMHMRGNPYDYDQWAEAGNKGWSYKDLLPYFKMSENNLQIGHTYKEEYHGTSGPVTISQFKSHPKFAHKLLQAAMQMNYSIGEDLNGESQLGFTLAQATHSNGSRLSMYNAYIAPLVGKQKNLIVSPYSFVTKILFADSESKKAIGVEYIKNDQTHRVYARKEVIITGGAVQSPMILMLSGIGPKEHLKKMKIDVVADLPHVGENLQNHASYSILFSVDKSVHEELLNDVTLYQFLTKREGPLTSTGLSQTTGFVRVNNLDNTPKTVPQIQMFFEGFLANCSLDGKNKCNTKEKSYITISPCLLRPKSQGNIKLRSSKPTDPPVIQANYLDHKDDRQLMVDSIKFAIKMSQTPALRNVLSIVVPPTTHCKKDFGTDEYWHCAIQYWNNPENHQVGTCVMGTCSNNSVVDNELRVHRIKGLRVVDASIMPREVSGNVNAPIMMIAEKGADLIKKTWAKNI